MIISNKKNYGILTFPVGKSGLNPISQLITLLMSIGEKIYLITGNSALDYFSKRQNIIVDGITHLTEKNFILRILKYIKTQFILSYMVLKYSKKVNMWFSIFGSELIFPTIMARLTRKKVIQIIASSNKKISMYKKDMFSNIIQIVFKITNFFSNFIILYSPLLIEEYGLKKLKKKIIIVPRHFIDLKKFFLIQPIMERENIIGFIGRLSEEKGILNFLKAITIFTPRKDIKYLIIGEGNLKSKVVEFIKKNKQKIRIQLIDWVNHEYLNKYLNKIKLLVIPSYTEGLPNIMLEAMAAGTLVVASKVGAIPNIIKDGINSFLLENNHPITIYKKISEILKKEDLTSISENAVRYIKNNFTFKNIQKKFNIFINYINEL